MAPNSQLSGFQNSLPKPHTAIGFHATYEYAYLPIILNYMTGSSSQPPKGLTLQRAQAMCHREPKHFPSESSIIHILSPKCVPWRYFWWGRFSSSNGFAWEFKDEVCNFKKRHHGLSRGKLKRYFKSPDNKINRQLPSGGICLWLTKATVAAVCLKRPPHSLIVLAVRFFCPHL